MNYCTVPTVEDKAECLNTTSGQWLRRNSNFDHIFQSMLTLFEVALRNNWEYIMYDGNDRFLQTVMSNKLMKINTHTH